jgi:hypothetical protein
MCRDSHVPSASRFAHHLVKSSRKTSHAVCGFVAVRLACTTALLMPAWCVESVCCRTWQTADSVPAKPGPQAAALQVCPCCVWPHAAAQAALSKGAPLVVQPAVVVGGRGVEPQEAAKNGQCTAQQQGGVW